MRKSQLVNHVYQVLDSPLHNHHFFQKTFIMYFHLESKLSSLSSVFKRLPFQLHIYCIKQDKAWFYFCCYFYFIGEQ